MTQIVWDEVGSRKFQTGIDHAVFYTDTEAVPWNGIISVDVKNEGLSVTPVYFDDRKVNEIVYLGDFSGVLTAYTYPDEFLPYDGYNEPVEGVFIDNQDRGTFGLCYRTIIGNDEDGIEHGYKLHILYNLTAIADGMTSQTVESNVEPIEFKWNLSSIPDEIPGYRPSSHIIIDSTKVDPQALSDVEDILYGTESEDPRLLSMLEIFENIALTIVDHGDGSWSAIGPSSIISWTEGEDDFDITSSTIVILDADSYQIS